MAWRKGKPTVGTARKRSDLEIAADRLFLVGVLLDMGKDFPVVDACKLLNDRREQTARETAALLGKSEDEVEAAGKAARISRQTAARDVRAALARINEGQDAVSAVFLDRMIEDVEADYDRTYQWEDQLFADLEASRSTTKTLGTSPGPGQAPVPTQLVTVKGGGDAAIWSRLLQVLKRRQRLREELLRLRVGRQLWPTEAADQTFAQALTGADSPEEAKAAALRLYEREVEFLCQAESVDLSPVAPELARIQASRSRQAANRLAALRSYIRLPPVDGGDRPAYEIIVSKVEPEN